MADTKQATAEAVCEHCGRVIHGVGMISHIDRATCWVHSDGQRRCDFVAAPRTQPIQELRIPDDLKELYAIACIPPGRGDSELIGKMAGKIRELIERIARLEGAGR